MTISYTLSGFATPTGGEPGFLIPLFVREDTHRTFVQELDGQFRIKRFQQFLLDAYKTVSFKPEPLERKIGEVGVVAFAWNKNDVVYDTPAGLREKLKQTQTSDPFLELEIGMFVGDPEKTKSAIIATGRAFDKRASGQTWTDIETKLTLMGKETSESSADRPPILLPLLAKLARIFSSRKATAFTLADMNERFREDIRSVGAFTAYARYGLRALEPAVPIAVPTAAFIFGAMSYGFSEKIIKGILG